MEERTRERTQIRKPRLLAVPPKPSLGGNFYSTSNFGYVPQSLVQARRAGTPVAPPDSLEIQNLKVGTYTSIACSVVTGNPAADHASNPPTTFAMFLNPARSRTLQAIALRYPLLQCTAIKAARSTAFAYPDFPFSSARIQSP